MPQWTDEDLIAHLFGELAAEKEDALQADLRADARLRARLDALVRTGNLLREAATNDENGVGLSPEARARVLSEVHGLARAPRRSSRYRRGIRKSRKGLSPVVFATIAAAVFIAVGLFGLLLGSRRNQTRQAKAPAPKVPVAPSKDLKERPAPQPKPRTGSNAPETPPDPEPLREIDVAQPDVAPAPPSDLAKKTPEPSVEPESKTTTKSIAVIANVNGLVKYARGARGEGGAWAKTIRGIRLLPHDRLHASTGTVRLDLEGGSQVYLNQNTLVSITRPTAQPFNVRIERGEVYVVDEGTSKVTVETYDGIFRPVGTRFDVKRSGTATIVTVEAGIVEAASKGHRGRPSPGSVRVKAGMQSRVRKGDAPTRPRPVRRLAARLAWKSAFEPQVYLHEPFETYKAGKDPKDWRDTGPNNSFTVDDALFHIHVVNGNRVLAPTQAQTNIHSHYVGRGAMAWRNYRVTGKLMLRAEEGGVGITFLSQFPQRRDRYYRLRCQKGYRGGRFHFQPHPYVTGQAAGLSGTLEMPLICESGKWYAFRIEVEDGKAGTVMRARVWPAESPEPRSWPLKLTDTSANRLRAGTIGVWSMGAGGYVDELRVEPLLKEKTR